MTRWMDIAWQEQGTSEMAGAEANPAIVAYFRDAGRADVTSDEVAWCAAFVGAVLARAGVAVPLARDELLLARAYLKVGTPIDKPRPGAIAVFSRGDPSSWQAHVGFVTGATPTHIVLLGGNQRNRVCVAHYPRSQLVGLRWPEAPTAPASLEGTSRIVRAAGRQKRDAAVTAGAPMVPAPPTAEALPTPEALVGKASALQGSVEAILSFLAFASGKWPWIVAFVALYYGGRMAWDAWHIRQWRAEDNATGKTVGA